MKLIVEQSYSGVTTTRNLGVHAYFTGHEKRDNITPGEDEMAMGNGLLRVFQQCR